MITPLVIGALTVTLTVSGPAPKPEAPPAKCKDKTAQMLWHAGFKGNKNRIAWAITFRESRHANLDESSPWYSGALGMWQVQTSAHSGKAWWSRSAMLDPARQSRIVYKYMTQRGTVWSAWGLTSPDADGIDSSQYGMWSSSQQYALIWAPYQQGLNKYPQECAK